MGDAGRFDHAHLLERDCRQRSVIEDSKPLAEEHGDQVNLDLVKQPGGQILLRCAGTTAHQYILPGRYATVMFHPLSDAGGVAKSPNPADVPSLEFVP